MRLTLSDVQFAMIRDEVILATIEETGGGPSGALYAPLMTLIPLETYEAMLTDLITQGKITRKNHWLEPTKPTLKAARLMRSTDCRACGGSFDDHEQSKGQYGEEIYLCPRKENS